MSQCLFTQELYATLFLQIYLYDTRVVHCIIGPRSFISILISLSLSFSIVFNRNEEANGSVVFCLVTFFHFSGVYLSNFCKWVPSERTELHNCTLFDALQESFRQNCTAWRNLMMLFTSDSMVSGLVLKMLVPELPRPMIIMLINASWNHWFLGLLWSLEAISICVSFLQSSLQGCTVLIS